MTEPAPHALARAQTLIQVARERHNTAGHTPTEDRLIRDYLAAQLRAVQWEITTAVTALHNQTTVTALPDDRPATAPQPLFLAP